MDKRSRYKYGVTEITHKGVTITTNLNSDTYTRFSKRLQNARSEVGYIPAGYESRPDLISDVFYADPSKWWAIMEVNNIDDPFEGLPVRTRIIIPTL